MAEARWFLAHTRHAVDADVNSWRDRVSALLSTPEWPAKVTAGRDDYKARIDTCEGWRPWAESCAKGADWAGEPLYHGFVVPMEDGLLVGRATSDMLEVALAAGKYVYCWNPADDSFREVKVLAANHEGSSRPLKRYSKMLFDAPTQAQGPTTAAHFVRYCEQCIEYTEAVLDPNPKGHEFRDSVVGKITSMKDWAEQADHFTAKQLNAISRMMNGVSKWDRKTTPPIYNPDEPDPDVPF